MIIYQLGNQKSSSMFPRLYTKSYSRGRSLLDFLDQPATNLPKATMKFENVRR